MYIYIHIYRQRERENFRDFCNPAMTAVRCWGKEGSRRQQLLFHIRNIKAHLEEVKLFFFFFFKKRKNIFKKGRPKNRTTTKTCRQDARSGCAHHTGHFLFPF